MSSSSFMCILPSHFVQCVARRVACAMFALLFTSPNHIYQLDDFQVFNVKDEVKGNDTATENDRFLKMFTSNYSFRCFVCFLSLAKCLHFGFICTAQNGIIRNRKWRIFHRISFLDVWRPKKRENNWTSSNDAPPTAIICREYAKS